MTRLHGVLVTFHRPTEVTRTLDALALQSRPLDTLTVVDNSPKGDGLPPGDWSVTERIRTFENLGPAGGLAAGVAAVLRHAGPTDWVVFIDDDDPPVHGDTLDRLHRYAEDVRQRHPSVGAVGIAGGRFDLATARLERVDDDELVGDVAVDFLGGNQFPTYSVAALREVGGPASELFFGFDDLELGLRLRRGGFELLAHGDVWLDARNHFARLGITPRQAARARRRSTWRRYYSTRNLIWIAHHHGTTRTAFFATARYGIARAALDVVRERDLRGPALVLRGMADGLTGRMGRTVEPA